MCLYEYETIALLNFEMTGVLRTESGTGNIHLFCFKA